MPFVQRDEQGSIVAVSRDLAPGFSEEIAADHAELVAFLRSVDGGVALQSTDLDFVRVLEDVVDLLIDKGVILFTELPATAQDKILHRQRLRSALGNKLDLIGEE